MRIVTPLFALCLFLISFWSQPASARWFWSSSVLVTIDGDEFSTDDFRSWWDNWKEKDQLLPETPDPFIDWTLEYREAERMRLYESPQYRRKILTFLKARALMMLKAEEIDSKIAINDGQIRTRYRKQYTPITKLLVLVVKKGESAAELIEQLPEPVTAEALKELAAAHKDSVVLQEKIMRPASMDEQTKSILNSLNPGQLSGPLSRSHGTAFLFIREQLPGNDNDFQEIRERIRQQLWKEQEDRLTADLLTRLREKYQVRVDKERIKAIDINAPLDDFSDQDVLIRTSRGTVSARHFIVQVKRQLLFRKNNGFPSISAEILKGQVLNGIIDQTLTTWESLDRGYEKKPPFRDDYLFYCRNNLVRQLEQRMLKRSSQVSDQEIEAYYKDHIKEFTRPAMIKMAIVEGTAEGLKALWSEVAAGGDFRELAAEMTGHPVPIRELPANHLDPTVKGVIDRLTAGELSPLFTVNGHVSLLELVDKKPARPLPLEQVRHSIRQQIARKKQQKTRQEFLQKLRSNASISINETVWRDLQQEMGQKHAEKKDHR